MNFTKTENKKTIIMADEKMQDNASVIAFPPLMFASTLALDLIIRFIKTS